MNTEVLLDELAAPARRALEGLGVRKVEDPVRYPEAAIQAHGPRSGPQGPV